MGIADAAGFTQYGDGLLTAGGFAQSNDVFKDDYLPAVRNLVNNKRILSRFMRRNTEDVYGNRAVISLRTGRNEGMNSIDELGDLPDPEGQGYNQAAYRMRFNYGRIKVSGPSESASASDRGAWLSALDGELNGLVEDIQHEMNRINFGDGSGRLCRVTAPASGTSLGPTFACDLPGGFANNQGKGTQYLRKGMKVAIIQPSFAGSGYAVTKFLSNGSVNTFWIMSVDYAAGTFQLSATNPRTGTPTPVTLTNAAVLETYYMVKASVGASSSTPSLKSLSYMKEPYGLAAIVSDTNPFPGGSAATSEYLFGEIDATTESTWQAYIIDNAGVPMGFDQDLLQQMLDGVDMWGDGDIGLFMTSHGVRRRYANSLISAKRYVNKFKLDGGFEAVEFDMRPMVCDKDCTRGRIYGLDRETIQQYYQTDWFWMDADGSILHRMPNQDAYQAVLVKYCNNGTDARNRNGGVFDIEDF